MLHISQHAVIWPSQLRHKSDRVYSEEQQRGDLRLGLAHYDSINSLPYITDESTATADIKAMNKSALSLKPLTHATMDSHFFFLQKT